MELSYDRVLILTKLCTQIIGRNILVEFVNRQNHLNHFKMADRFVPF